MMRLLNSNPKGMTKREDRLWNRAKEVVRDEYRVKVGSRSYWALVNRIYNRMKYRVGGAEWPGIEELQEAETNPCPWRRRRNPAFPRPLRGQIEHHTEEGACEHCGYPLYVGDAMYYFRNGRAIYCTRECAMEEEVLD
jgi:hypothetical protein